MSQSAADAVIADDEEPVEERLNRLEATIQAVKQRALNAEERSEEAEQLAKERAEENAALHERIERLETALDANPDGKVYAEMSRAERVRAIKHNLVKKASKNNGKTRVGYKDVLTLFHEEPSDGYAFKLMKLAAGWDDETKTSTVDGFGYGKNTEGEYRLSVNLDAVNDKALIHTVNNDLGKEGGD